MVSNMQHVFRDSTPPIRRDMNNIWHHFAISKKLNHVADIIKLTKNAIEFHDSSDHAVFMEIFWIQFFDQGIPLGISRVFLYNVLIPVTTVWGPHTSIKLRMASFSVFSLYKNQQNKRVCNNCMVRRHRRYDYQIQSNLGYPNKHTTITRGRGQGHTTLAPTLKKKPCKSTCDLQVTRTHHTQNIYNGVPGVSSATCRVQKTMH